jgi:DNA-binding Xre family transcriptional regulator
MSTNTIEAIYKYNIRERLAAYLPAQEQEIKQALCAELNITRVHLNRILNYKRNAPNEALPSQLQVIAQHLGCTIDDLLN